MSGEAQKQAVEACPLPPEGFHEAELPVHEMNLSVTTLLRIHWRIREPVHYNRRSTSSTVFRLDAPNDEFGVLYASPSFEACMAETLMRGRYRGVDATIPHIIGEQAIIERCVATLG